MIKPHIFPLRVYFEDTDAGGIVYYANYLRFAERARTEMLRSAGIESGHLMRQDNITLTVKTCHVDYQKPAHLDDALKVYSRIIKVGGASFYGQQKIKCYGSELVNIQIKLACVNIHGKPTRLPNKIRSTLNTLCST
jgi:acyl-CoA thioester hydrolase